MEERTKQAILKHTRLVRLLAKAVFVSAAVASGAFLLWLVTRSSLPRPSSAASTFARSRGFRKRARLWMSRSIWIRSSASSRPK